MDCADHPAFMPAEYWMYVDVPLLPRLSTEWDCAELGVGSSLISSLDGLRDQNYLGVMLRDNGTATPWAAFAAR
jgi:hypothetical protein